MNTVANKLGYGGIELSKGMRVKLHGLTRDTASITGETGIIKKFYRKWAVVRFDKVIEGRHIWHIRPDLLEGIREPLPKTRVSVRSL